VSEFEPAPEEPLYETDLLALIAADLVSELQRKRQ
jgi:hypothetical protein